MTDLNGLAKVVQRCVAGPVYCDTDRQAMTVYLAVQLPRRVDVPALERALADLQERFPFIRQLVVEVGGAFYYAQVDVMDQIIEQQEKDHVIIIDSDIEIKPREDGGFVPVATPWDPDETVIILE